MCLWRRAGKLPFLLFLLLFGSSAQEPVIRVDVNLVRILTTVKDTAGAPVGTLSVKDFEVFDNGVRQEIAVFERYTELPLVIALMVDTSGSTAKDLRSEVASVSRFLKVLLSEGNPRDAVALYSFNYQVVRHNLFTHNHGPLERSLKTLKGEAGTSLYDAMYLAAHDLETRDGRRVMVMVTDGGDTVSTKDFHAALEAAQTADSVVFPILIVPITNDAGRNTGGENALTTLAARTGGRVFAATLGNELDAAFAALIHDLRTQYLLAYYPKNVPLTKNRFHRLDVRVQRPELRVLARTGYYGESEDSAARGPGRVSTKPEVQKQEK
jgi:Ca-activated chloride channel family protein